MDRRSSLRAGADGAGTMLLVVAQTLAITIVITAIQAMFDLLPDGPSLAEELAFWAFALALVGALLARRFPEAAATHAAAYPAFVAGVLGVEALGTVLTLTGAVDAFFAAQFGPPTPPLVPDLLFELAFYPLLLGLAWRARPA